LAVLAHALDAKRVVHAGNLQVNTHSMQRAVDVRSSSEPDLVMTQHTAGVCVK
jgi:hypothetical protein